MLNIDAKWWSFFSLWKYLSIFNLDGGEELTARIEDLHVDVDVRLALLVRLRLQHQFLQRGRSFLDGCLNNNNNKNRLNEKQKTIDS
jgi:hypothetical protein